MAQQMPQFRQVNTSPSLYNPAGMAMNKQASISLLARWQMLGFGNEPRTIACFGQAMIKKKVKTVFNPGSRIQYPIEPLEKKKKRVFQQFVGGQAISDNYGAFKYLEANGNYALCLPLNNQWKLSAGIRIGIRNNVFSPSQASVLNLSNPQLPYDGGDATYDAFLSSGLRSISLSSGFGMTLFSRKMFFAGALQHGGLLHSLGEQSSFFDQRYHWNTQIGYTMNIANGLELQPILILKQMHQGPISVEMTLMTTINYIFWAGINYQYNASAGILAGMEVSDNLKIGYAFDFSTNRINRFSNGGHEIYLSYGF
jgi:type IX secretion system PorP/SprF family membrane protein